MNIYYFLNLNLNIKFLYKSHLVLRKFQRENNIKNTIETMVFTWFS